MVSENCLARKQSLGKIETPKRRNKKKKKEKSFDLGFLKQTQSFRLFILSRRLWYFAFMRLFFSICAISCSL